MRTFAGISSGSYVAAKMSGLHGENSPFTPLMIQSPIDAVITPSSVGMNAPCVSLNVMCSSPMKARISDRLSVVPLYWIASMTTGFFRYLILLLVGFKISLRTNQWT